MKHYIDNFIDYISINNLSIYFNIISLLFILFPISLVTGPFLPDLLLTIIALYFVIESLRKKLYVYYKNLFVYAFVFFYIVLLTSGLLSEDIHSSLVLYNGPVFYFRYLFFILGIKYLIDINPKLISYFTTILSITILITILDGLVQWQIGYNILGFPYDPNHGLRITGFFRDEQILGHFLGHVVPLCFGLLIYHIRKGPRKNIFILALFIFLILSEVFIFITNDRAAFLRIFQFTLLLIFLSNHFKLLRLISFLISLIFIFLLINFSSMSHDRYVESTLSEISNTKIPYMPWTPLHEEHFAIATKFFTDSPIIGNGPQYFRYKCNEIKVVGCSSHPHNYYFQILAELGIIGIFFLLVGFIYLTSILFRQFLCLWVIKNKVYIPDHIVCLYIVLFLFIWPLIPNGSFYNNWLNSMVFLPIPFIMYFQKNYDQYK